MTDKLTLSIDRDVITRAKIGARKRKTSISRLVESYLRRMDEPRRKVYNADKLSGCLKKHRQVSNAELKNLYLKGKHGV